MARSKENVREKQQKLPMDKTQCQNTKRPRSNKTKRKGKISTRMAEQKIYRNNNGDNMDDMEHKKQKNF